MKVSSSPCAFEGRIEPTRLSAAYRFGLVIVVMAMLMLPLLYVGSIVLTGTAVWWHLTANAWIVAAKGSGQWRLLVYLGPALVGLVLMFFMVKPLLARPSAERDLVPIDPQQEPVLMNFIEAICRQVRAPLPARVQVDCQVNASAGFLRRGLAGVLSRDVVLTIGLPLAAGLTTRQLGGVLAHEFGHFAQGGGMRLTAVVRAVNAWFARVVFERDAWDDRLEDWSKHSDWRLSVILVLARGAVWVSRQILRGLMMAGHAISCFMLRQMEFDADSYEIKLSGSETFAHTSRRMRELHLGLQFAYPDVREGLRNRALPSHLPAFVIERTRRVPGAVFEQMGAAEDERTGTFDTHPCDADRLRAAERAAAAGVMVAGHGPATELFADFDGLSAAATRHHYEHELGLPLGGITLVATEEAIRESATRDEERRAFATFFGQSASPYRPLLIPDAELDSLDPTRLRATWADARDQMAAQAAGVEEQYRRYEAIEEKRDAVFLAEELFGAGLTRIDPGQLGLPDGTPEGVRQAGRAYEDEHRALGRSLDAFERTAVQRLAAALRAGPDPATGADARRLVHAANALARAIPIAHELRRLDYALAALAPGARDGTDKVGKRAELLSTTIAQRLDRLRDDLSRVPYPSDPSARPLTVAERCGLRAHDRDATMQVADHVLGSYYEIMGRLAAAALDAEAQLGSPLTGFSAAPGATV